MPGVGPDRIHTMPRASTRRALWTLVLVLLGALVVVLANRQRSPGTFPIYRLVSDPMADLSVWTVERLHPRSELHTSALCPSLDADLDGADRPALILPPPAVVHTVVGEEPVLLRTAAGVSHLVAEHGLEGRESLTVAFEVAVDGATIFAESVTVRREPEPRGTEWIEVGGADGIALAPGNRLTLKTAVFDDSGAEIETPHGLPVGFRQVLFESVMQRERERSSPETPNILFIVQDTLRADRMSTYGYERPTTPHADRLAERGVLFDEAYATSSWTWPSTASMLTGLLPPEHGVTDDSSPFLDPGVTTLAEALQEEGYTTAAWSGNPLVSPGKNFGQGFESFWSRPTGFRKSDEFVPEAVDWIRENAGRRFFLYAHLVDVHEPHRPTAWAREAFAGPDPAGWSERRFNQYARALLHGDGHRTDGESMPERVLEGGHAAWMSDLYDACVATGDEWLGRLIDAVDDAGLAGETLIVFTSDHGEEFLDHGLLAHGQSLYEELISVPLIAAGPGLPAGMRLATPVSNRHLAPTLARVGGARFEALTDPLDLFAAGGPARRPLFFSTAHGFWNGWYRTVIHGVRVEDWSLQWAPGADAWGVETEHALGDRRLYDLSRDGEQRTDLSEVWPLRALELEALGEAWLSELEARSRSSGIEAGEATLELLRDIGYIGD